MDRPIFYKFVSEMDKFLKSCEFDFNDQKKLLQELFKLENDYKTCLLKNPCGKKVYKEFMDFILHDRKNILASRVFFRERQGTFARRIAPAFHKQTPEGLHKFKINYTFVEWSFARVRNPPKKMKKMIDQMISIRQMLCQTNLPLAINRAKIFWSRVPDSHLEYMDLIQTASEGLMNAIDKFVPPYKTVFRSVAIGRMTSNMISDHNSTLIKFSPKERRILYRANNAKNKAGLEIESEVVNYVNESFDNVTGDSLNKLISAATNVVSIDEKNDDSMTLTYKTAASDNTEASAIDKDLKHKLNENVTALSTVEQKLLAMKFGFVVY